MDSTTGLTTNQTDRPSTSRIDELKTAFESSIIAREDASKTKMPVTTSLTEQRRRIFEDQDQTIKDRSSSHRRSVRIIEQRSFCARKKLLRLIIHFRSPWVNNCFIFLECQRVHVSGFAFVFFSLSLSALLRTNQNGGRSQIN